MNPPSNNPNFAVGHDPSIYPPNLRGPSAFNLGAGSGNLFGNGSGFGNPPPSAFNLGAGSGNLFGNGSGFGNPPPSAPPPSGASGGASGSAGLLGQAINGANQVIGGVLQAGQGATNALLSGFGSAMNTIFGGP